MQPMFRVVALWVLAAAMAWAAGGPAALAADRLAPLADGFPNRPITLWASFGPGHSDDIFNKIVAEIASDHSPVRIVTANYPQAGTRLHYGTVDYIALRPGGREGYHVIGGSYFGGTLRLLTRPELRERGLEDVLPLNIMESAPYVFVVHRDSPFQTLRDVEEWARQHPGELTVVASTAGSGLHITASAWARQAGVRFRFLPTDGAGQSQTTLLGGGAQLAVLTFDRGIHSDLRVLAVSGDTRASSLPDVPAVSELGYRIPSGSERGFMTHPDVPAERVRWLNALFEKVVNDPRFKERRPGMDVVWREGAQVEAVQREMVETFTPILQELGLLAR